MTSSGGATGHYSSHLDILKRNPGEKPFCRIVKIPVPIVVVRDALIRIHHPDTMTIKVLGLFLRYLSLSGCDSAALQVRPKCRRIF